MYELLALLNCFIVRLEKFIEKKVLEILEVVQTV